ncbi:MAG: rRNA maturation RNase YbeY [Pseudomonadota bacterium]
MNREGADVDETWVGRVCVQFEDPVTAAQLPGGVGLIAEAAELALPPTGPGCTVRIVDQAESRRLNHRHRGRDTATNVLSFPTELPAEWLAVLPEAQTPHTLGDIAVCLPVTEAEATAQGKRVRDHFMHLIVHGVLHLRGFDHITDPEAEEMERLERDLLASRGIGNPYDDTRGHPTDSHG